jgi:hypothetical protein
MPVTAAKDPAKPSGGLPFPPNPTILLASDSVRMGNSLHQALRDEGFAVDYAGDYSSLKARLSVRAFDLVLLEVTGEYAVEAAVQAALLVKRGNAGQFVGYLADSTLNSCGLAGDGVFPRSTARLPEALRRFFSECREPGAAS